MSSDPDPFWKGLEPNWPLVSFVVAAFLFGKFGFSIFLLPILLYFFMQYDKEWRKKAVFRELKNKLQEESNRSDFLKESSETAFWLNQTLRAVWPHLDRSLSSSTTSFLIRMFAGMSKPDDTGKSKSYSIDVKYVSFGKTPVVVDGISAIKPKSPYSLRLDMDFTYRGETEIELNVLFANFVNVPVLLKELEIRGKMRIELSFKDKGAIRLMALSFKTPPTINFSLKTLAKLDIMDLPTFKSTLAELMTGYMRSSMVYPNSLNFDWSGQQGGHESQLDQETKEQIKKKFVYQTVSAIDDDDNNHNINNNINNNDNNNNNNNNNNDQQSLNDSLQNNSSSSTENNQSNKTSNQDHSAIPTDQNLAKSNLAKSNLAKSNLAKSVESVKKSSSASGTHPLDANAGVAVAPKKSVSKPMESFDRKKEDVNEFLLMSPEEFSGTLRVRVLECSKLPTSDIFSVNPYVILEMNGLRHVTDVVKRSSNPAWRNALFEFPIPKYLPPKGLTLKVQVLDKEKIGSDNHLGVLTLKLSTYLDTPDQLHDFWAHLSQAVSGSIHLQCQYLPE